MGHARGATAVAAALCLALVLVACGAEPADDGAGGWSPCRVQSPAPNEDPHFADWRQVVDVANPRYLLERDSTTVGTPATYPPGPGDNPGQAPAVKPAPRLVASEDVVTGRRAEREFHFSALQLTAYEWANAHAAQVLVGRSGDAGQRADDPVHPLFMLVVPATDRPFFVGPRVARDYEQPLQGLLGSRYEATLRALLDGPVTVPEPASETAAPEEVMLTGPGDVSAKVRGELTHVAFVMVLPRTWSDEAEKLDESYAVGTRIALGWNDFLPLTWSRADGDASIGGYLPAAGDVEVWVLGNDGDPRARVRLLGTLDAAVLLASMASQPESERGILTVTVAADRPLADILAGRGTVRLSLRP